MAKPRPDKHNVVPLGEQQSKQPRGEAVRVKLLDAAEALLLEQDAHQLRLDDLLADAGVARNTLYKHFKDLEALAEEALLRGFARNVELDAQAISGALGRCQTKDDFRQAMTAITRATQSADRAPRRMLRIKLLAMAGSRPALRERVAAVQADMTERLADEFRQAQDKGYVRSDFPARTAALFIQSYTIGRVLLDVEPHTKKDETDWVNLIDRVIELGLLP
jgi:AcrR family transcriptional regulator